MRTKICTKCLIEKPLTIEFFDVRYDRPIGFRSFCKACRRNIKKVYENLTGYGKKYQRKNHIRIAALAKERRHKDPKRFAEAKYKHYKTDKRHYSTYKSMAKKRNLLFDLSFEEFKNLIVQNCFYCGSMPNNFNGLDRIDSSKGYFLDNVTPSCKNCNLGKQSLSQQEFLLLVGRIATLHKLT
jgi:hypothetical protein